MKPWEERNLREGARQLIAEFERLSQLSAELGLWRTYHALNAAKREIGYEVAAKVDPKNAAVHERARDALERGR